MQEDVEEDYGAAEPESESETRSRMAIASCLAWTVVLGGLGYGSGIATVIVIPRFAKMFDELLGGEPLPGITELVLGLRYLTPASILLLTTLGLAAIWIRRDHVGRLIAWAVLVLQLIMVGLVTVATFLPLMKIMSSLGG